jgi:phage tail-like protein
MNTDEFEKPISSVTNTAQSIRKSIGGKNNDFETHTLNYVTVNRFYVEMESDIQASFSECSGLQAKVKREVIYEGGLNDHQKILVGPAEYTDVTLKRGVTNNLAFCNWITSNMKPGIKERRNINILLFNQAGETVQCWTLLAAIPVGWKAPSLQASGNSVALEELTIAYEGLKISNSSGGGASILGIRDTSGIF